jgi:hypothetical protein
MEHQRKPYDPTTLAEDFSTVLDRVPALSSLYRNPDAMIEEVRAIGVSYANGIAVSKKTLPTGIEQPRITRKVVALLLSSGLDDAVQYITEVTARVNRAAQERKDIAQVFYESTRPGEQVHGFDAKTGEHYERMRTGRVYGLPDCDGHRPTSDS